MGGNVFYEKIVEIANNSGKWILGIVVVSILITGAMFTFPDEEGRAKARKGIIWVVIGAIVMMSAVAIAKGLVPGV